MNTKYGQILNDSSADPFSLVHETVTSTSILQQFNHLLSVQDYENAKRILEHMISSGYPSSLISFGEQKLLASQPDKKTINKHHVVVNRAVKLSNIYKQPAQCEDRVRMLREFGKGFLGPLLHVFYARLITRTQLSSSIGSLFFLAREGYLLQQGFETLCRASSLQRSSKYLVASRTLLFRLIIANPGSHNLILSHSYKGSLLNFFLYRCGLQAEELGELQVRGTVFESKGMDSYIDLSTDRQKIASLLQDNLERLQIITASSRNAYRDYLDSIGFMSDSHPSIVDIGYSGTIQKALSMFSGNSIKGHYMVTTEGAVNNATNFFTGYLFNRQRWGQGCILLEKSLYLETLLTAPVGSALNIHRQGNGYRFDYGPETISQKRFADIEEIFAGAIEYCIVMNESKISTTPQQADLFYEMFVSCRHNFPPEVLSLLELEDAYSGLGTVKPVDIYHA